MLSSDHSIVQIGLIHNRESSCRLHALMHSASQHELAFQNRREIPHHITDHEIADIHEHPRTQLEVAFHYGIG